MDYRAPRGNITTVLDFVERDGQDDTFFPYTSNTSWFAPDGTPRSIAYTPALQTFNYRGPAGFGQKIVIDVNSHYGDFLHSIAIQLQLDSWIPRHYILKFINGTMQWKTPATAWNWVQYLGNCLIERATFEVGETIIEEIDTVFSHIALTAWPDSNTSTSIAPSLEATDDCKVTCFLPFWFSRIPFKEAFPLVSCTDGTIRVNITFRRFEDVVQRLGALCGDTPLNSSDIAVDAAGTEHVIDFATTTPGFRDITILSYSSYLGTAIREQYLRRPFEHICRLAQRFIVDNPLLFSVTKSNKYADSNLITIPLPFNGPIEELIWVIRRKSNALCNFSYNDSIDPLMHGTLMINGSTAADMPGHWFRSHLASLHRGGIEVYNKYIYGYSFARAPGEHQPSGSLNFSKAQTVELKLTVRSPGDGDNWEVHVYGIGLNWLRFENGICGRIFST
jgi:hypothetical protein